MLPSAYCLPPPFRDAHPIHWCSPEPEVDADADTPSPFSFWATLRTLTKPCDAALSSPARHQAVAGISQQQVYAYTSFIPPRLHHASLPQPSRVESGRVESVRNSPFASNNLARLWLGTRHRTSAHGEACNGHGMWCAKLGACSTPRAFRSRRHLESWMRAARVEVEIAGLGLGARSARKQPVRAPDGVKSSTRMPDSETMPLSLAISSLFTIAVPACLASVSPPPLSPILHRAVHLNGEPLCIIFLRISSNMRTPRSRQTRTRQTRTLRICRHGVRVQLEGGGDTSEERGGRELGLGLATL
ncbi:hypothetical protein B0H14DRAFT_3875374 [Mycena olivaceomarginata]|nr:hypothetical protein B0H14DRAFT_3875374 [Mycena olivaceomarginata]